MMDGLIFYRALILAAVSFAVGAFAGVAFCVVAIGF